MQSHNKNLNTLTTKSPLALAVVAAIAGLSAQPAFALGDGAMCAPTSTFTVTSSLGDASVGTLTAAIILANAEAGCSQIQFASDVTSINLDATTSIANNLNIVGHGRDSLNISTIAGNAIHATSGDLHISHLKVSNSPDAGIYQEYGQLTVDDVLLDGNGTGINIDTVFDTVIRNSSITNSTTNGGILFDNNGTGATLLIDKSDISNNAATGNGGGFNAHGDHTTSIKILDSTIANNTSGDKGGGIYINNAAGSTMDVTIEQSTLSSNEAIYGGGIYYDDILASAPLTIKSSTIVNNVTRYSGAGINHKGNGGISIQNSVIALNTATNSSSGWVNLDGVFNTVDHSWLGNNNYLDGNSTPPNITNPATNSVIDGDDSLLNISTLADNGGPTFTHVPLVGSPLLETGNPATVDLSSTDQRGVSREVGILDIGAVERIADVVMDISQATGVLTLNLGEAFSINLNAITSSNDSVITVSGLPNGVSFNAETNIISGTATGAGASEITVSVVSFDSSVDDTLELYVTMNAPSLNAASISEALNITTGKTVNIDISGITSDEGVTLAVSGLPEGLTFDSASNLITGVATLSGTFEVTITAQNTDKETVVTVELDVQEPASEPSSSSSGGSFGFGWLLILAGIFTRRKR